MADQTPERAGALNVWDAHAQAAADAAMWREIALALAKDTIRVIGGEEGPWRVHDCRGPWPGRRDSHASREAACLAWHAWSQRQTEKGASP